MNTQRFIISVIAVFAFMFAYEFVVHGQLMMPIYNETPQLWRTPEEMQALMPWSIITGLALSAIIAWIFVQHYENKGHQEGLRFGLWVGLLLGVMQFGAYNYLPISMNLALAWLAILVVEGLGIGLVLSATYRA